MDNPEKNTDVTIDSPKQRLRIVEDKIDNITSLIKPVILKFIIDNNGSDSVRDMAKNSHQLEGLVSALRLIPEGQLFILKKIQEMSPDLKWYRAGSKQTFSESTGWNEDTKKYYSPEDLNTTIIDKGANGMFGEPVSVQHWFHITKREKPVLYSLTIDDLIYGVENEAIQLVTEHHYDLRVVCHTDRKKYLQFCRERLKIEDYSSPQQSPAINK